ncbi:MAG TPA: NADH-ubiquinone oxidoreductase-F iron-sulfur binding region domain-containing protein [Streptosporangiaceae bacterium]|nr:NADH-ubiquinone oxidoreductase-F iron-sulfur binding region domain-containing protein [Streptosporangiaceae bacterium]
MTMAPDMRATVPRHARPADRPLGLVKRLTIGWRDTDRVTALGTHLQRYGALPPHPPGTLIEAVTSAGLTGRGGAGFPTGVKMRAVAERRGPAIVVANGMESEPASDKDEALLSRAPHLVLDGAAAAAREVGATTVAVCLPRAKQWLLTLVREAVAERVRAGYDLVAIEVYDLPHGYVSSSESALVNWLNGGEAKPLAVPPRPFEKGVGRRPTMISNVETFAHIALIARFGPGWFRQAGLPDAPGSMLITTSGAVAAPGVYEVDAGITIGAALSLSGGAAEHIASVLVGGYFGSWHNTAEVTTMPLASSALKRIGAGPGAGVIVALPAHACGLRETAKVLGWLAGEGAQQCGPCMFGLPAIAEDFAQLATGRPQGQLLDRLHRRLGMVSGRGACAHPDGAVRLARSALAAFAADARAHAAGLPCLPARQGRSPANAMPIPASAGGWR